VFVDFGDEEALAKTSHRMGCQTSITDYGSTNPPGRMDCSALVSVMSLLKATTHPCVRCVGSCTAHLEELTDPTDLVQGVGTELPYAKKRTADIVDCVL
jgi:hypothetical protein